MFVPRTARFDEEAARFGLRHTCEDCGYFDEVGGRCHHEWPTERHRHARYERLASSCDEISFCKEFELR